MCCQLRLLTSDTEGFTLSGLLCWIGAMRREMGLISYWEGRGEKGEEWWKGREKVYDTNTFLLWNSAVPIPRASCVSLLSPKLTTLKNLLLLPQTNTGDTLSIISRAFFTAIFGYISIHVLSLNPWFMTLALNFYLSRSHRSHSVHFHSFVSPLCHSLGLLITSFHWG